MNAAWIIDRELVSVDLPEDSELAGKVELNDAADPPELSILHPVAVMDYLLGQKNGFGHKSMVGILCLADFVAHHSVES